MPNRKKENCGCGEQKEQAASCGCGGEEAGNPPPLKLRRAGRKPETGDDARTAECSCGGPTREITKFKKFCVFDMIKTAGGHVPVVSHKLCITDIAGNLLVRLGINRMSYAVKPGLYATGKPGKTSPVLVSANYKMSFNALRKELGGIDAWILVLDSKGVNVWCAAGKGTFGTLELVKRALLVKLDKVVSHRNLIVPQLGAPGIAAHIVRKYAKFNVVYGPVEARDIKEFLDKGMKADEKMRTVTFGLKKRMEVLGIEFVTAMQILLGLSFLAVIAASFTKSGFSLAAGFSGAANFIAALFIAAISATIIPAALLPVLPGRMFSIKGAFTGLAASLAFVLLSHDMTALTKVSIVLLSSAMASFVFMNYTGTTTFTSLTGVRKEIAFSVPVIIIAAVIGLGLQIADFIMKGAIKWN